MKRTKNFLPAFVIAALTAGWAQTTELVPVVSKPISRTIELPGEFQPFQSVSIHARSAATWIACWLIAAAP